MSREEADVPNQSLPSIPSQVLLGNAFDGERKFLAHRYADPIPARTRE
jgi:hypothetical protein